MQHSAKHPGAFSHRMPAPTGERIDLFSDGNVAGAWLELHGNDHSLSVVSTRWNGGQKFIQYRDGVSENYPRFAAAIEEGKLVLYFLAEGDGPESGRLVKTTPEAVLAALATNPAPQ